MDACGVQDTAKNSQQEMKTKQTQVVDSYANVSIWFKFWERSLFALHSSKSWILYIACVWV